MIRIESGVSLYDYTKMMILGELMETGNAIVKRKEVEKADRVKLSEVDYIKLIVCNELDISIKDLLKKTRKSEIREARQIAVYFCRQLTDLSFPRLGKEFEMHHTSIIHCCNTVANQIKYDVFFRNKVSGIEKCITEN